MSMAILVLNRLQYSLEVSHSPLKFCHPKRKGLSSSHHFSITCLLESDHIFHQDFPKRIRNKYRDCRIPNQNQQYLLGYKLTQKKSSVSAIVIETSGIQTAPNPAVSFVFVASNSRTNFFSGERWRREKHTCSQMATPNESSKHTKNHSHFSQTHLDLDLHVKSMQKEICEAKIFRP